MTFGVSGTWRRRLANLRDVGILGGSVILILFVLPVLGLSAMFLSGASERRIFVYPSPDRQAAVLVEDFRKPGLNSNQRVFLVGDDLGAGIEVGQFFSGGWSAANGWSSGDAVNICELFQMGWDADLTPTEVDVATRSAGLRTIHVTTHCPAEVRGNSPSQTAAS